MPRDTSSNDYFKHLEQPAAPPQQRKLRAPTEPTRPTSPTARPTDKTRGPGLSPGLPSLERPVVPGANDPQRPRSSVMLTPGGVVRTDEAPAVPPPVPEEMAAPAEDEFAERRQKNDEGEVGWEEYAATDFPALPAENLGVKTKMTDSGRVVPVAVRADLTDEALKGKSIKDKGGAGRAPKPAKPPAKPADAPRSWMGRIGHSLRMKLMGGKVVEEDEAEIDQWTEQQLEDETKGFARSGSLQGKKSKRKASPFAMVKGFFVEVVKLVMLVLLLRAYVLQVSEVNGPSMEPTLLGGGEHSDGAKPADRLVVERVTAHLAVLNPRWTDWIPEAVHPRFRRGDIIVVRSPENPGSELVKRLIALPGDVIKFDQGKLWIKYDGKGEFVALDEPYVNTPEGKPRRSYDVSSLPDVLEEGKEVTVPDQRVFVMGDNRGQSNDSRRWLDIAVGKSEAKYGGVASNPPGHNKLWLHMSSIEGRVLFRIYPFDRLGKP